MRNKNFIRIMAIVALVAFATISLLAAIPSISASAESAQEKVNNSVKKQKELKDKINSAKTEKSSKMAQKQALDSEISSLQSQIDKLSSQISASNAKIASKQDELAKAQKESEKQYESYHDRAKMLIERGSISYLEILVNSKSFGDFLSRMSIVKQIARYDSNRLEELKKIEQQIAAVKQELENEKSNLVSLQSKNNSQMSALKTKQAQSQEIINSLANDISAYEKALKAQEAAEASARAEIKKLMSAPKAQNRVFVGGTFMWPSTASTITSPYGSRTHPITGRVRNHAGVDIGASYGSAVYAANSGTVLVAGWNSGGYGNYVVIDHGGGLTTLYAHCSSLCVSTGQSVSKGQVIAKVGSTGMSSGPHLHFEVLQNGSTVNPMSYFN